MIQRENSRCESLGEDFDDSDEKGRWIGRPVERVEDPDLLTGEAYRGRYGIPMESCMRAL